MYKPRGVKFNQIKYYLIEILIFSRIIIEILIFSQIIIGEVIIKTCMNLYLKDHILGKLKIMKETIKCTK